jgi:hypothetical protein
MCPKILCCNNITNLVPRARQKPPPLRDPSLKRYQFREQFYQKPDRDIAMVWVWSVPEGSILSVVVLGPR